MASTEGAEPTSPSGAAHELWALQLQRYKRVGVALVAIGGLIGPVPAGMALAAAGYGELSRRVAPVIVAFFVAGMTTLLTGGSLLNAASRLARRNGTELTEIDRRESQLLRSVGTFFLRVGIATFLAGLLASLLKTTDTVSISRLTLGSVVGAGLFLAIGGRAMRMISELGTGSPRTDPQAADGGSSAVPSGMRALRICGTLFAIFGGFALAASLALAGMKLAGVEGSSAATWIGVAFHVALDTGLLVSGLVMRRYASRSLE